MSGAADTNARAVAQKAIAAYGGLCSLARGATALATNQPCMELEDGALRFRDASIQINDRFFMLAGADFPTEPEVGDILTTDGVSLSIVQVKRVKPGLAAILYYLRASA